MQYKIDRIIDFIKIFSYQDLTDMSISDILHMANDLNLISLCELSRFLLYCEIQEVLFK